VYFRGQQRISAGYPGSFAFTKNIPAQDDIKRINVILRRPVLSWPTKDPGWPKAREWNFRVVRMI
jgi:hypothetical protein